MNRVRPNNRRASVNFEVTHSGHRYVGTIGMMPDDNTPIEIFVSSERSREQLEALARDGAIIASFARQYGAPFAELQAAVTRDDDGSPMTIIGAVLDAIAAQWPAKHEAAE